MTVIVDSREKEHIIDRILKEFDAQKVVYTVSKLWVGDYLDLDHARTVVDRKYNLQEVATNLCTGDKTRFWKEVREAKRLGVKLLVLCEQGGQYDSIQSVVNWPGMELSNKVGKVFKITGRDLMEQMYRVHISYGVEFLFCKKADTGNRIIELLGGGSVG